MFPALALFIAMAIPVAAPNVAPPASSQQSPCALPPIGTTLIDPPALYSKRGVLELTLTLEGASRRGAAILCWVYKGEVNGRPAQLSVPPSLNVTQGDQLRITLVNTLTPPYNGVETPPPIEIGRQLPERNPYALMCGQPQLQPTPTPDPVTGRIYGYHRSPWNEANLHFHGLNTSPQQPGDNVTDVLLCPRVTSLPGTYHYVVDIPRDEPPGTYWYHPHAHGEALYQIFLGLTGAIVVHSAQPSIPDSLPNRLAIVRDQPAQAAYSKYARMRMDAANGSAPFARDARGGDPFQPPDRCPAASGVKSQTDALTVNGFGLPLNGNSLFGLPEAKIELGQTQYWRFANTAANTTLDVMLIVNGKPASLMVTSRDGVPLIVRNGKPTYQPVPMEHIFLMPAARFEFYLTGAEAGADMVLRTRTIDTGCIGDNDLARDLFHVVVGKQRVEQSFHIPPPLVTVNQRFSDLPAQVPTKKRTFILTEYARSDEPEPDFYITETSNPKAVEHPYRMSGPPDIAVKVGTVEEWTILNFTNEIHAFHIHQIHFMPTAGVDSAEGLGQLLDTVLVPHGGYERSGGSFVPRGVKLKMDFRNRDIVGTFVYHCHIMEHEDGGMMARIQVVP
jgi:FtsP/CotA-like multicopper oxidase with cupredoxin domain